VRILKRHESTDDEVKTICSTTKANIWLSISHWCIRVIVKS